MAKTPVPVTQMKLTAEERRRLDWLGEQIGREVRSSRPIPRAEVVRRLLNDEYDRRKNKIK